jgi:type II secretory pathway component PulF
MILLRAALEPALVLAAGTLVLALALSIISPIVTILQSTMPNEGVL